MLPNLESKILQSVGDTGLILEPASGLDQESDGGSGLAMVNGSDLDTAGGVDDSSERACETRRVANSGGRCSQHWWAKGEQREGMDGEGNRLVGGRLQPYSRHLPSVPAWSDAYLQKSSSGDGTRLSDDTDYHSPIHPNPTHLPSQLVMRNVGGNFLAQ